MNGKTKLLLFTAALLVGAELLFGNANGSLLLTFTIGIALVEGAIALAAITEVTGAKWLDSIKDDLLSLAPFLLVILSLLIPLANQMEMYPWAKHPHGLWFNAASFIARNAALILIAFALAQGMRSATRRGDESRKRYAVIYLIVFALSQSLTAFDIVMSLSYPWFSTLLGGYFFIEAIFAAIGLGAIHFRSRYRGEALAASADLRKSLWDLATLLFGFSVLWVGLLYSQYLVIWYGNLPAEVGYFLDRFSSPKYLVACWAVLACLFPIPFVVLLSRRRTANRHIVAFVGAVVIGGILLERFVMLKPLFPAFNYPQAAGELIILISAILGCMRRSGKTENGQHIV